MSRDCSGGGKQETRRGIENGGPLKERDKPKVNCESSHNRKLGRAPPNQSNDPGPPNNLIILFLNSNRARRTIYSRTCDICEEITQDVFFKFFLERF